MKTYLADSKGFYGQFGGTFIPDILKPCIDELQEKYLEILNDPEFQEEYYSLLKDYVGRPSPLYLSKHLSQKCGCKIYLKREDLNHTGAHKINNTIGQILLAKRLSKTKIIAETGAGQHGVATATVCALMGMDCHIYMGKLDVERQHVNVQRMEMLGATVHPATSGSMTLKDAVDEAIAAWAKNPSEIYYLIGSTVGPHPYPDMVSRLQSIISKEIKQQLEEKEGRDYPDYLIACIGGGSNASGTVYHFVDDLRANIIFAEAGGKGVETGETAASISAGKEGILHGFKTLVMYDENGEIKEPYSISAGLDYPGIGPLPAHLAAEKRALVLAINDDEALKAAFELTEKEGIIPALESAHALAVLDRVTFKPEDVVVVTLSGRGDKDINTYLAERKRFI
ncbi:Tryptophan synthase beta chain [Bacteroides coprosuis DSM 18011]|uniref:Tryptophan synthase beta chain n=1 Tax=Bacteroides coprosuis DSM 18011 TaxID=679937 RepID=F3ZUJ1_9BACE|nr:tryptophan synthase subunit beta [Bacteroides coprosuis]EGJ71156.1 Tryptophan synthase beta chain [Bacteroides coprosuis DSM 18011]